MHLARARVGVERVDDAQQGAEGARGDARLGAQVREVGDGGAGGLRREGDGWMRASFPTGFDILRRDQTDLGSGTGRSGHGNQRPQSLVDRLALADRGVDKVVQVRVRVAREQVGDFLQSAAPKRFAFPRRVACEYGTCGLSRRV